MIVTDFGIGGRPEADLAGEGDHQIRDVAVMAPERLLGRCDARSDVYALGVTLYEFITQRLPLPRRTGDSRGADPPVATPALARVGPQVPRRLETIISNAMAAEPMTETIRNRARNRSAPFSERPENQKPEA